MLLPLEGIDPSRAGGGGMVPDPGRGPYRMVPDPGRGPYRMVPDPGRGPYRIEYRRARTV